MTNHGLQPTLIHMNSEEIEVIKEASRPQDAESEPSDPWTPFRDPRTGRFLPGAPGGSVSGGGRPKGHVSIRTHLQERLRANPTQVDEVMDALHAKALEGDVAAIKLYVEANDGLQVRETRQEVTVVPHSIELLDRRRGAGDPSLTEAGAEPGRSAASEEAS